MKKLVMALLCGALLSGCTYNSSYTPVNNVYSTVKVANRTIDALVIKDANGRRLGSVYQGQTECILVEKSAGQTVLFVDPVGGRAIAGPSFNVNSYPNWNWTIIYTSSKSGLLDLIPADNPC